MVKEEKNNKDEKGITAEKDEFSEWFTQLMVKADLADYTRVSGCMVLKPRAYAMWEKIMKLVNERLKKMDVDNVYFPLFIPESLLKKEQEHVKGFSPEVAWVSEAGDTKLSERLAVRPTSEAIMYDSFAKWIRSWRELPLKYNQWSNVVRWEFKHPIPFFRTREFLFNEGHTVFGSKEEAEKEKAQIINMYKDVCENYLALPGLVGRKTDKEKFAGAEYTISIEYYMPNGRGVQGPDFHFDGQNFAKAYNIKFLDKDGKEKYVWQNTWAISTRMLGVMFAIHSDSKGLVLPPKIAPNSAVIVPIFFEDSKAEVLKECNELKRKLKKYNVILDLREEYNPGFKFNEWELKGIPVRIEVGPKDLQKNSAVLVRRDNNNKEIVKISQLDKKIGLVLKDIQDNLFEKAKKMLEDNIVEELSLGGVGEGVDNKKIVFAPMCSSVGCEDMLKFKLKGVKILNIPEKQPAKLMGAKCIVCGKRADYFCYVGKSY